MAHSHDHEGHSHNHSVVLKSVNTSFIIGICLNMAFVIAEVIVGLASHSLSLLSDAGHNLADVGSLALSLLAFRLLKVKANENYTYGYRKTSVLAALANAIILFISLGAIVYEAIYRFSSPQPLPGITISIVAGIGILINGISAFLFLKDKEKDINIKSAYLHLLTDALISAGVAVAGIIIYYTKWYWLDAAVSIAIATIILITTWGLLRDSLRLSLDGVPPGIVIGNIREVALKIEGVRDIHHIHVWALSSAQNALTAHLVVAEDASPQQLQHIKEQLKHELIHQNITHITLETETSHTQAGDEVCQAKM